MASQDPVNVAISAAAVTNTLVAATSGYKIRVLSYVIDAADAVTAQFLSKSSVTDSYSESNADTTVKLFVGDVIRYGQSFTATHTGLLETCRFSLSKLGTPTGNVTAKLYAHTGTLGTSSTPTGGALATSGNLDISTLTTSQVLTTLTFTTTNRVELTAGTNYTIEVLYNAGGDTSNCLRVGVDTATLGDDGNAFAYTAGYAAVATTDVPFYVNVSSRLSGVMSMVVGQPIVNGLHNIEGHFETKSGEALNLTLSTTVQVSGHLTYCLIPA